MSEFKGNSFKSMMDQWHHRVRTTPDGEAMIFRKGGDWTSMTWGEAGNQVRDLANSLLELGIKDDQRVAILAGTRPEWILADYGIVGVRGVTVTIYPSNTPDECAYILKDADCVAIFAENDAQVDKLRAVRDQLPALKKVVVMDGTASADGWVVPWEEFKATGRKWAEEHAEAYDKVTKDIEPDHMATFVYTSGTTGRPKGAVLTHKNWVYIGEALETMGMITPTDKQFLFLPLAHVFGKSMVPIFVHIGVPTVVDGRIDTLVANLGETNPTWMAAVPRIFEKAYNKIVSNAKEGGKAKVAIFNWAVKVGGEVSKLRQQQKEPSGLLALQYRLADKLVFSKVKARFGGNLRFFISGGAPLSKEIAEFFHACDILILEGFGLTESSAATIVNRPEHFVFGSVGIPLPGSEFKIAEDGEILLKGGGIMKGYHNHPEDTAEAITEDGWLRTGDIGVRLESGHLKITDRKKELIITAGGKNIAPAHFQGLMKMQSTLISQVLMHGDKRPYCVALITVDPEATTKWAEDNGISYTDMADLTSKPELKALLQAGLDRVNRELPSYESVKKFAILPEDLSIENGALTPSMKVKRRVVEDRYRDILDGFYTGTVASL
ncbi:MAG: long-chain fatty acid--CoA ligase [Deltaproteobacteria bacterium]|nr:long-chain fatty acid--CoA ligase [Deltaproteobacteria bacterium]